MILYPQFLVSLFIYDCSWDENLSEAGKLSLHNNSPCSTYLTWMVGYNAPATVLQCTAVSVRVACSLARMTEWWSMAGSVQWPCTCLSRSKDPRGRLLSHRPLTVSFCTSVWREVLFYNASKLYCSYSAQLFVTMCGLSWMSDGLIGRTFAVTSRARYCGPKD